MKIDNKKCCGGCCWFKFEDIDGYGTCQKPHGVAKKCKASACEQRCSDDACENFISEEEMRHYLAVLIQHNRWRRDDHVPNSRKMADPKEIGKAIDFAINYIKTFMKL